MNTAPGISYTSATRPGQGEAWRAAGRALGGGRHRAPPGLCAAASRCWWKLRSRRLRADSPGPTSPPPDLSEHRVRACVPKAAGPWGPAAPSGRPPEERRLTHTASLYLEPSLQTALDSSLPQTDARTGPRRWPCLRRPVLERSGLRPHGHGRIFGQKSALPPSEPSSPFSDENQNPVMEGEEEVESAFPPRLDAGAGVSRDLRGTPPPGFARRPHKDHQAGWSPQAPPGCCRRAPRPSWLAPGPGAGPCPDQLTSTSGFPLLPALCPCPAAREEESVAAVSHDPAVDTPVRGPEKPNPARGHPLPNR